MLVYRITKINVNTSKLVWLKKTYQMYCKNIFRITGLKNYFIKPWYLQSKKKKKKKISLNV